MMNSESMSTFNATNIDKHHILPEHNSNVRNEPTRNIDPVVPVEQQPEQQPEPESELNSSNQSMIDIASFDCDVDEYLRSIMNNRINYQHPPPPPPPSIQPAPNSFYNYSMLSLSKSQIKPELYQLAFDVHHECDNNQIEEDCQWSTVIIDEPSSLSNHTDDNDNNNHLNNNHSVVAKQKTTIVTHNARNDRSRATITPSLLMTPGVSKTALLSRLHKDNSIMAIIKNGANSVSTSSATTPEACCGCYIQ